MIELDTRTPAPMTTFSQIETFGPIRADGWTFQRSKEERGEKERKKVKRKSKWREREREERGERGERGRNREK
jgi:hypothetical protein